MVAAGAVVTEDVPDYCLVKGVPAKICGKVDERGNILCRYEIPGGKTFFLFIQSQSSQDKIALWISLCRIKKNNSGDMK